MRNAIWIVILALTAADGWSQDISASVRGVGEAEFGELGKIQLPQLRVLAKGVARPPAAAPSSAQSVPASRNYEKRIDNPDGSTTIVQPRFGFPDGESRPISLFLTDNEGMCRLFGLGRYVAHQSGLLSHRDALPVIDNAGRLSRFEYTAFFYQTIICSNSGAAAAASVQYESLFRNDDGSVSISEPRFDFAGTPARISLWESDMTGVCRLFGFGKYVTHESEVSSQAPLPVIDKTGKLCKLIYASAFYKTIVCSD